jgi:hypothetical protein
MNLIIRATGGHAEIEELIKTPFISIYCTHFSTQPWRLSLP